MNSLSTNSSKQFLGLPLTLIWGYIAVAVFMTGDGIEQAFLSKYIVSIGFEAHQASAVLTPVSYTHLTLPTKRIV